VRVVAFDGSDREWDELVSKMEGSTFCHLSGWGEVLGGLGHYLLRWVAVEPSGEVSGLLPMARVKSRLFGDYLLSMPFLSYGGPLGSKDAQERLVARAIEEARRLSVDLMELRARHAIPGDLAISSRKLTVLKELPSSPEELWEEGLKSKVRSQIRRPMKEGLTSRCGTDLVDSFYPVFSRTMRDLGTPVLPKAFFDDIARMFADSVVFAVVELDGQPLAAGCGFLWQGEYEITWAGALREFSRVAPNMLLYWALMEETVRRGGHTFNFGRCSPGSGTHRFKQQWGTTDHPLPWAQWSPRGISATPNPDSRKFALATSMWSRLPLPVANTLGPLISRSLP
jgi:FemAB-related protein (PEP-CTERM system-associated)